MAGCRQLRVAPSGVIIGFDLAALLELAVRRGDDPVAMTLLLPAIEAGLVEAINEQDESGSSEPL